jgi:hypothetical protein
MCLIGMHRLCCCCSPALLLHRTPTLQQSRYQHTAQAVCGCRAAHVLLLATSSPTALNTHPATAGINALRRLFVGAMPHLCCCWQPAAPLHPTLTLQVSTHCTSCTWVPCLTCAAAGNQFSFCTQHPATAGINTLRKLNVCTMPHLCCCYPPSLLLHPTPTLQQQVSTHCASCTWGVGLTCAAACNQPPHCTSIPRQLGGLVGCWL